MGRTACTEHQCVYSAAKILLQLWAIQNLKNVFASMQSYKTTTLGP